MKTITNTLKEFAILALVIGAAYLPAFIIYLVICKVLNLIVRNGGKKLERFKEEGSVEEISLIATLTIWTGYILFFIILLSVDNPNQDTIAIHMGYFIWLFVISFVAFILWMMSLND